MPTIRRPSLGHPPAKKGGVDTQPPYKHIEETYVDLPVLPGPKPMIGNIVCEDFDERERLRTLEFRKAREEAAKQKQLEEDARVAEELKNKHARSDEPQAASDPTLGRTT
jgi:hypothetical protein